MKSQNRVHRAAATDMPEFAPEGLRNRIWIWRGQRIRYVSAGDDLGQDAPAVLLVHGLFVNADHWRNNIGSLSKSGFRVFAVDLLGYGYSSKPYPTSDEALGLNGENGRNLTSPMVQLGDASGSLRGPVPVELRHPVGSAYNFYTWAEQLADFADEMIGPGQRVTLVCNSIGTISGLQAAIDRPEIFDSVFIVNPNFRELHTAESPGFIQPVVRLIQRLLREKGRPLFDSLAKPGVVKNILKTPYYDSATVTDDLVDVLLSPLLIEGSADVVFDTLSYSGGPLPEQQLGDPTLKARVAVCVGEEDPWTPLPRVFALDRFDAVKCITLLPGTGHCPHDETPQLVNPLIVDFVRECRKASP